MRRLFALLCMLSVVTACRAPLPEPTPTLTLTPSPQPDPTPEPQPLVIGVAGDLPPANPFITGGETYYELPLRPGPYMLEPVTQHVIPLLAEGGPPPLQRDEGVWFADVTLRRDVVWSDGEPLTAHDWAYTAEIERPPGVHTVTALDDRTVRLTFEGQPTYGDYIYKVLTAPIVAQHYWQGVTFPLSHEPQDEPLLSPYTVESWRDEGIDLSANPYYPGAGMHITAYEGGGVRVERERNTVYEHNAEGETIAEYTVGPHIEQVAYLLSPDREQALLRLDARDTSIVLFDSGVPEGLRYGERRYNLQVEAHYEPEQMTVVQFNSTRPPFDDPALRRAIAATVDPVFIADTILGGAAIPVAGAIPPGARVWGGTPHPVRDPEPYPEQFERAVSLLTGAGYGWQQPPTLPPEGVFARDVVVGSPLLLPTDEEVPMVTIIAPNANADPLQATPAVWLEEFMRVLGIPTNTELLPIDVYRERLAVGTYDAAIAELPLDPYPAYLHQWMSLPSDDLLTCTTLATCQVAARLAAQTIADDVPLIPLQMARVLVAYNADHITLPFGVEVSGGLNPGGGYPHLLRPAE